MKSRTCALGLALALAACSHDGGTPAMTPPPATATATLELLAGHAGGASNVDGTGSVARFTSPQGLVVDADGNILVGSGCTLRKVTPAGVVTTFANASGCPTAGTDPAASIIHADSLAIDGSGNVYVLETLDMIRKVSPAGAITTLTGIWPNSGMCPETDGPIATANLCLMTGLAVDPAQQLVLSTTTTVRKVSTAGIVSTFAGSFLAFGNVDGVGTAARFSGINGIATDVAGNIYAADSVTRTIRVITPAGVVTTLAGSPGLQGSIDGQGPAASFVYPTSLTVDAAGNVYVGDLGQAIRKITPGGQVSTLAGAPGMFGAADGVGTAARFGGGLISLGTDRAGNVYVGDNSNDDIRKVTPDGTVTTLAGSPPVSGSADGVGSAATFTRPTGIALDGAGNLYVADGGPGIRKVSPSGQVTTLFATGAGSDHLTGIAVDGAGNVFAAGSSCVFLPPPGPGLPFPPCSGRILKVTPAGVVTTFAGTAGVSGSADGVGAAASFQMPVGLAMDSAGNLLVADFAANVIRKISPAAVVTTIAGTAGAGGTADGAGAGARFRSPAWIAADRSGNAYVTDYGNDSIRKISAAGDVATLVPAGVIPGSLQGIAVDDQGALYVAERDNSTISKVTAAGMATTIAGVPGQASFQPGPLPGKLFHPIGLAVEGTNLFITLADGVAVVRDRP